MATSKFQRKFFAGHKSGQNSNVIFAIAFFAFLTGIIIYFNISIFNAFFKHLFHNSKKNINILFKTSFYLMIYLRDSFKSIFNFIYGLIYGLIYSASVINWLRHLPIYFTIIFLGDSFKSIFNFIFGSNFKYFIL